MYRITKLKMRPRQTSGLLPALSRNRRSPVSYWRCAGEPVPMPLSQISQQLRQVLWLRVLCLVMRNEPFPQQCKETEADLDGRQQFI